MDLRNKKIILILIIIAIILYLASFQMYKDSHFNSPDENGVLYISSLYSNSGEFHYKNELNENLTYKIINPRGMFYYNNKTVSAFAVGQPLIMSIIISLEIEEILNIISLIIFIPFVLFLFLFFKKLYGENIALTTCSILLFLAPIWRIVSFPMLTETLTIMFYLGFLYYLSKAIDDQNTKYFILMGLFSGLSFLVNYRSIFLVIATSISFILINKEKKIFKKVFSLKNIISFLIPFLIIIFILLYTNNNLYGDPFTTGYSAQSQYASSIGGIELPLFYMDFKKMESNITQYIFFIPLLTLITILGFLTYSKREYTRKFLIYTILIFLIPVIIYFSNIASFASTFFSLASSYFRYIFALISISIVGFTLFLKSPNINFGIKVLLITILITTNCIMISNSDGGINYNSEYQKRAQADEKLILENTPEKSIIITGYYDKLIFPERLTADISNLPGKFDGFNRITDVKVLAKVTSELYSLESPLFFLYKGIINFESYESHLKEFNITIKQINKEGGLYQLKNEN
jgi:hypothetical protein